MINNKPTGRTINISSLFWSIVVLVLVIVMIIFSSYYMEMKTELAEAKNNLRNQQFNVAVLDFNQMFIKKVLKAEEDVDFESRLKLETAVRALGDQEILAGWNSFVNAENDMAAQKEVKELLFILAVKARR
jgi:hypothetical protein